jgi:hypothetical protein
MEQTNMAKPIIRIHDLAKDEIIDREMTESEYKVYEADQKITLAKKVQDDAKAQAKAEAESKLAALGLTTDDLRALGL